MVTYGINMFLWTIDPTGDRYLPLFGRLKMMGYDSVEIPVFDTEVAKYAALGRDLDKIGLARTAATAVFAETNPVSPDAAVRRKCVDYLRGVIDGCRAVGSKLLIGPMYGPLGVFTGQGPTKEEWSRSLECLREAADHAKGAGVTLAIEFLNRFEVYLVNCAADAVRYVRDAGHPNLRMMYDTFHANIEEKSIAQALSECADHLAHVHVSENDRSTPGKGGVNWSETFAALKKIRYDRSLTIEAFGLSLPALAAATKIWRRMFEDEEGLARDGLAFMKSQWEGRR